MILMHLFSIILRCLNNIIFSYRHLQNALRAVTTHLRKSSRDMITSRKCVWCCVYIRYYSDNMVLRWAWAYARISAARCFEHGYWALLPLLCLYYACLLTTPLATIKCSALVCCRYASLPYFIRLLIWCGMPNTVIYRRQESLFMWWKIFEVKFVFYFLIIIILFLR